jgi:hypothetical protein
MPSPTGTSREDESLDRSARLLTLKLMIMAKQEMVVGFAGGERKLKLQIWG